MAPFGSQAAEKLDTEKHLPLTDLATRIADLKRLGYTIAQCHGVFDLVHPGHIKHFQAAKQQGDILVVTVTADRFVNKGPGRPIFDENLRAESVAALAAVDYVAINNSASAVEAISLIKPDVYVKGNEYADAANDVTGKIAEEEAAVLDAGGRLHFTNEDTYSSSSIINQHARLYPQATEDWLQDFRKRYRAADVIEYLKKIRAYRPLIVGEAIIDEYVFCNALGKAAKDPILAFQYASTETYAGGSLAVANHMAGFCDHVGLFTILGAENSREEFIRKSLKPGIDPRFVKRSGVPTIHKRRFIDSHSGTKPFELYEMDDSAQSDGLQTETQEFLSAIIGDYDIVVVTDYGHGMMTPGLIETVVDKSKFLAVNTQVNAGNRGFNPLSRYTRADYVSIAGNELEHEMRVRGRAVSELVLELPQRMDCSKFTITLGRDGSIHYDKARGFAEAPALAVNVVDRVGAGDAVLAVTAALVAENAPWDVIGFITNLAGAEMVRHLGNRITLDYASMAKHVEALLKT